MIDFDDLIEWCFRVAAGVALGIAGLCLVALVFYIVGIFLGFPEQLAQEQHQEYIATCVNTGRHESDCELRFAELKMIQDAIIKNNSRMDADDAVAIQSLMSATR